MDIRQIGSPCQSCARCNRTFKRLEHLKRHERIHDDRTRFTCSTCPKTFTRSDILRRHEATHVVAIQPDVAGISLKRACTECARAREKCTKSEPCQRCTSRDLQCAYPKGKIGIRNKQSSPIPSHALQSPSPPPSPVLIPSLSDPLEASTNIVESSSLSNLQEDAIPDHTQMPFTAVRPLVEQIPPFEMTNFVNEGQSQQFGMDFPMNWLPMDDSISIDYDNILGLDINLLGGFPPIPMTDVRGSLEAQFGPTQNIGTIVPNAELGDPAHLVPSSRTVGQYITSLLVPSPSAMSGYVSSASPGLTRHSTISDVASDGLYATSTNDARMPCTTRGKRQKRFLPGATPLSPVRNLRHRQEKEWNSFEFPDTRGISVDDILHPVGGWASSSYLDIRTYEILQQRFSELCLTQTGIFSPYSASNFPDHAAFNMFVHLYFENFDAIIPFVHNEVTNINQHWLIALAVSAIGCQYIEADEFSRCVVPLHEMLRRATTVELEAWTSRAKGSSEQEIALSQAMTLNHFGIVYSGSQRLLKHARTQHGALVELARSWTSHSSSAMPSDSIENNDQGPYVSAWKSALLSECKRRIGYSIWLLDCMAIYHHSILPCAPLAFSEEPLPNDKLWLSRCAGDWIPQRDSLPMPSLSSAVAQLFREKQVREELGQFSRILLLHGVYHEVFQRKNSLSRPLSGWVPSMQQTSNDSHQSDTPSSPDESWQSQLSSWRNAGLDCVDVLHWAANATIAFQAGTEHPTVLHLHLSRTVLLAPIDRIQILAASIAAISHQFPEEDWIAPDGQRALAAERDVLEWAQRDQYKARLAVLHCGCFLWHIRRYSCRAFYEPISVYIATLTMWAYSSYVSRAGVPSQSAVSDQEVRPQETNEAASPDSDTETTPTFIHLDRPNDDEMVQYFVLSGAPSVMRANVTGVGDIYAAKGPVRILREGRKLLSVVSTAWARTSKYVSTLEALEQISSGRTSSGLI